MERCCPPLIDVLRQIPDPRQKRGVRHPLAALLALASAAILCGCRLGSRAMVAKYERLGRLPSEVKQPRRYRTRAEPFAADWPEIERLLERAPELEAKTLFAWLGEQ